MTKEEREEDGMFVMIEADSDVQAGIGKGWLMAVVDGVRK